MTGFKDDKANGKIGEQIFVEDYLRFLGIGHLDVAENESYQKADVDFVTQHGRYEIKANYKDDGYIIIEEYTNYNGYLAPISMGWFYKTTAKVLAFVSKDTRTIVLIPFTDAFKKRYEEIKTHYKLYANNVTNHNGKRWQSAYRRIPLTALEGFYAIYRKDADVADIWGDI